MADATATVQSPLRHGVVVALMALPLINKAMLSKNRIHGVCMGMHKTRVHMPTDMDELVKMYRVAVHQVLTKLVGVTVSCDHTAAHYHRRPWAEGRWQKHGGCCCSWHVACRRRQRVGSAVTTMGQRRRRLDSMRRWVMRVCGHACVRHDHRTTLREPPLKEGRGRPGHTRSSTRSWWLPKSSGITIWKQY